MKSTEFIGHVLSNGNEQELKGLFNLLKDDIAIQDLEYNKGYRRGFAGAVIGITGGFILTKIIVGKLKGSE